MRIPRDADHFRIDLEERPLLAGRAMAGQRTGAESNDGNAVETAMGSASGADGFREGTA